METSVDHRRTTADPEPRRATGFTLTEVLIAISLTGTLILTIVLAAVTLVRASGVSDRQANVEAALGGAADELAQFGWTACPEEATTS